LAQERAKSALEILEAQLSTENWLALGRPTLADIACYPYAALVEEGGVGLEPYKNVVEWCRRVPTNMWKLKNVLHSDSLVFVMESAGFCIAHLGHLHHALRKKQLDLMGRIDILMVPIDGFATISHEEVMKVIAEIKPKIIFPMHYNFPGSKQEFTQLAAPHYKVKELKVPIFQIGRRALPKKTEVLLLPSHYGDTLPSVDAP